MDYLEKLWHDNLEYPDIAAYFLKRIRQRDYAEQNPMSFGQLDENHPSSSYATWKPADTAYRGGKG